MDELISNPKLSEERFARDKEALEIRIKEVAEYIIKTGFSYRKVASKFGISVYTVSDYCKRYKKMYPEKSKVLDKIINKNKSKSVDNKDIRKRVLYHTRLILEGKTIEEVVEITKNDYWLIYRDLTKRLEKIDEKLFAEVKGIFTKRVISNLKNQSK